MKDGSDKRVGLAAVCAAISALCVAIPMYVIRPFRPQGASALALALEMRRVGPWLAGVCAGLVLLVVVGGWNRARVGRRSVLLGLLLVAVAGAGLTHFNIFEKMFHPYESPAFGSADSVAVEQDDKVLAVRVGLEARAYPIRTMGYHHIVNDTVSGAPIAVTYCTLCHTGLVWSRMLDGRLLYFRLAGINNGNALLRDEQTSSIWQQSTGEAIFGPLKGKQLQLVHSDELTFALWHKEQPQGQVLRPDAPFVPEYESKDWEKHIESTHVVVETAGSGVAAHQLMLGVTVAGKNKAFSMATVLREKLIVDRVGGEPVVVLVGPDGASMRVFEGRVDGGEPLTFAQGANAGTMVDTGTGSVWNFQGCAVEGAMAGKCLRGVESHKDYWFDWMNHHPGSGVFL